MSESLPAATIEVGLTGEAGLLAGGWDVHADIDAAAAGGL